MKRMSWAGVLATACALLLSGFTAVPLPDIAQVRGKALPKLSFEDDAGRRRELSSLAGQPLILVPTYTSCHAACPLVAAGLKKALLESGLDVRSFQVFLFSFDERNTLADLVAFRRAQKLPASWVVARLDNKAIRALTDALDYRTSWQQGEWAHPNAIAFASPDQKIAKFLYGVSFNAREVESALDVARGMTDWSVRLAPWGLALGMMGMTLSTVVLVHLLRARSLVRPRGRA